MARARKAGDDAYNIRRRARRIIANLEAQKDILSPRRAKAVSSYIESLQRDIEASLMKNAPAGVSADEAKARRDRALARLNTAGSVKKTPKQERANAIFRKQMSLASSGDSYTSLGKYGQDRVKIFYRATQRIWEGKPAKDRNDLIMKSLGVSSLEAAMKIVLSQNKEAMRAAVRGSVQKDRVSDFAEAMDFYEGYEDEGADNGSPDYIALVNII